MTTTAYKAQVISTFCNGSIEHTTYISARNEEEARAKLCREGFEVVSVRVVELTHLGGEVA